MTLAHKHTEGDKLVVVGGSAGALESLTTVLLELPAEFTVPVAIVLHIPRQRPSRLAELLTHKTGRRTYEPEDKQSIAAGAFYVAPPDYHLLVDSGPCFALSVDDPVHFSRPSIDVLFESAADLLGPRVIGVLLSGANADGAEGLAAITRAGGRAIVQDPAEALSSTMPEAGRLAAPTAHVLPARAIADCLCKLTTSLGAS